jgi:hypothetical protein
MVVLFIRCLIQFLQRFFFRCRPRTSQDHLVNCRRPRVAREPLFEKHSFCYYMFSFTYVQLRSKLQRQQHFLLASSITNISSSLYNFRYSLKNSATRSARKPGFISSCGIHVFTSTSQDITHCCLTSPVITTKVNPNIIKSS